jgi:hypothetical protein
MDMNTFEYEYKLDVSDLDLYPDIYSIKLKVYIVNSTYMNKILLLSS